MSSEARITANRANAQHSTGPSTVEGKRRSAMNALKHGILAEQLISAESAKEQALFRALHRGLAQELAPVGIIESLLVERIAACLWRLRRVAIAEAQAIELGPTHASNWKVAELNRLWDALEAEFAEPGHVSTPFDISDPKEIVYPTALPSPDRLALYARYEAALERHLYRALDRLAHLQATRRHTASQNAASHLRDPGLSVDDP